MTRRLVGRVAGGRECGAGVHVVANPRLGTYSSPTDGHTNYNDEGTNEIRCCFLCFFSTRRACAVRNMFLKHPARELTCACFARIVWMRAQGSSRRWRPRGAGEDVEFPGVWQKKNILHRFVSICFVMHTICIGSVHTLAVYVVLTRGHMKAIFTPLCMNILCHTCRSY